MATTAIRLTGAGPGFLIKYLVVLTVRKFSPTYIGVTEGAVTLTNAAGTITIAAGQIGFVGLGGVAPALVSR